MALTVLLLSLLACAAHCQQLLKNSGLEGTRNWDCYNIKCSSSNDRRKGKLSVKATNRNNFYEGPSQIVRVKENHKFTFDGWVKLLSDNGRGQTVELEVELVLKNGKRIYVSASKRDNVQTSTGWVYLKGNFVTPENLKHIRVYFQGPKPGVTFLADGASLKDIGSSGTGRDWKAQANARINCLRKSNIRFRVTKARGVNAQSVTIETTLSKHAFPFGTAVVASIMNQNGGGSNKKYRQFIYDHFNWAVLENAMKWQEFEKTEGRLDYNTGLKAVKTLRKRGIKVRGHNLLWAVEQWVPNWLKSKSSSQVRSIVDRHIRDTVNKYKGLVEHWDVNNEMLHGNWYVRKLNDPNYNKEVFKTVHRIDPKVKLFLNDYSVVSYGESTDAFLAQAQDYKASKTHVSGMGVQAHFGLEQWPGPSVILPRLDKLARAGLSIWATELDVQSNNENQRANFLGDALRLFFSHEAVDGILLWGFWSKYHWRGEQAALVSGDGFRVNAAGRRFLDMVHGEWKTRDVRRLSTGSSYTVRGFRGD